MINLISKPNNTLHISSFYCFINVNCLKFEALDIHVSIMHTIYIQYGIKSILRSYYVNTKNKIEIQCVMLE